jgi:hypothetical protein
MQLPERWAELFDDVRVESSHHFFGLACAAPVLQDPVVEGLVKVVLTSGGRAGAPTEAPRLAQSGRNPVHAKCASTIASLRDRRRSQALP